MQHMFTSPARLERSQWQLVLAIRDQWELVEDALDWGRDAEEGEVMLLSLRRRFSILGHWCVGGSDIVGHARTKGQNLLVDIWREMRASKLYLRRVNETG
jgi:hypothetical protein